MIRRRKDGIFWIVHGKNGGALPCKRVMNNASGRPKRNGPVLTDYDDYACRSKRSAFITLVHAATKSLTNFPALSSWA